MTNRPGNKSDRPRGRSDALKRARGEKLPSSFVAERQQLERNYEPGRRVTHIQWSFRGLAPSFIHSVSSPSPLVPRRAVPAPEEKKCLVVGIYPPGACGFWPHVATTTDLGFRWGPTYVDDLVCWMMFRLSMLVIDTWQSVGAWWNYCIMKMVIIYLCSYSGETIESVCIEAGDYVIVNYYYLKSVWLGIYKITIFSLQHVISGA